MNGTAALGEAVQWLSSEQQEEHRRQERIEQRGRDETTEDGGDGDGMQDFLASIGADHQRYERDAAAGAVIKTGVRRSRRAAHDHVAAEALAFEHQPG